MKVYVVCKDEEPLKFFKDKMEAHRWAEEQFIGSWGGPAVDGISVIAYIPVQPS